MTSAAEIGGDVVAAGSAIAGLMLVYIGALSSSYGTFDAREKPAVRASFQRRAWFAFVGLLLNALSIPFGLAAKGLDNSCALFASLGMLVLGVVWLVVVATLSVLEIK